jgi:hypothetical protein
MSQQSDESIELINFCKYIPDDLRVIEGIFKSNKIRFTQPSALNDPLEFNPTIKYQNVNTQYNRYSLNGVLLPSADDHFREKYIVLPRFNQFGILSLTKKIPDSFDMWNRYANGHKGIVIVFKENFENDKSMLSSTGGQLPLKQVEYVEEYCLNLNDLKPNNNEQIPIEQIQELYFYKKTKRWIDEREWRMVRPLSDSPDYDFNNPDKLYLFDISIDCIESVIFGAKTSVEIKHKIKSYCENKKINYWQAVIVRNEIDRFGRMGKIDLIHSGQLNSNLSIFNVEPSTCVIDKEQLQHIKPICINKLSDHPCYNIDRPFFDKYYKLKLKNS